MFYNILLSSDRERQSEQKRIRISLWLAAFFFTIPLLIPEAVPAAEQDAEVRRFDDQLPAFGQVPDGWQRVGRLETYRQVIERRNVVVDGDFTLRLTLAADPTKRSTFRLTLVGNDAGSDLSVSGTRQYTWSDNETWIIRTPAGLITRGLPTGTHTFILRRKGELFTFSADAVYRPDRNDKKIAVFAGEDWSRFDAIRIETDGPELQLQQLRLHGTAPGDENLAPQTGRQ